MSYMGASLNNCLEAIRNKDASFVKGAYLHGACKQMTIVRPSSGERRAIVERELRRALSQFNGCFERINLSPKLDDFELLLREIKLGCDFDCKSVCSYYEG